MKAILKTVNKYMHDIIISENASTVAITNNPIRCHSWSLGPQADATTKHPAKLTKTLVPNGTTKGAHGSIRPLYR